MGFGKILFFMRIRKSQQFTCTLMLVKDVMHAIECIVLTKCSVAYHGSEINHIPLYTKLIQLQIQSQG